jgi:SAM-dependent methyltransferase
MENSREGERILRHLAITEPSPWVNRFAPLIVAAARDRGPVLDLACGNGRHARRLLALGCGVVAVDRNVEPVMDLAADAAVEVVEADLETAAPVFSEGGPLAGRAFPAIVVVNYLYRPLFPALLDAIEPDGVLVYETFARGNERFTRPRNPDHLLCSGELLDLARDGMQVVAYEHGLIETGPLPGVIQRICAIKDPGTGEREDGEPPPWPVQPKMDV